MRKVLGILLVSLMVLAVFGAGCITGETTTTGEGTGSSMGHGPPEGKGYGGRGPGSSTQEVTNVSSYPAQNLSRDEIEAILYMREEEKLARDVYLTLYNLTGLQIFDNIAKSEQTHMDMVLGLIEKYNLTDPVAGMGVGEFNSTEMQDLYEKLVAQGSKSEVDALKVGALIEEIDIKDLDEWLERTDNEDVKVVFESLREGSENHLRAFTRILSNRYGVTYEPQVLSKDEYESIVG